MKEQDAVRKLVDYGLTQKLIKRSDAVYALNQILDVMGLSSYEGEPAGEQKTGPEELEEVLGCLLDCAAARGLLKDDTVAYRDLFDTRLMNCLMPRPSQVQRKFKKLYQKSPKMATDYYYKLSCDSDYIRRYRISRDLKWVVPTEFGELDVTVNLSKPEKDPKAIAAALKNIQANYPSCQLCRENEGYAGRGNHPARNTLRLIPITIGGTPWYLQYSPYVYYNEHCIALNGQHVPMKIDRSAFEKLLDFIDLFPHYFIGSNADLPIVGGSILTHDHFQGGRYEFAMAKAPVEQKLEFSEYPSVRAWIVKWPMSVIRLEGEDRTAIADLADRLLEGWRSYSDPECFIYSETDGTPHNTITPIARKRGLHYELDLVLRNNITTEEFPDGVFHPHPELHHIKKENIGLIEVMGLAVLPSRLESEMELLAECLVNGTPAERVESIAKHGEWAEQIRRKYEQINSENVNDILRREIGLVYETILLQCGVFKRDEAGRAGFRRYIEQMGGTWK
ncbi:UDP-glucose--hexose-1-phosphate uridylyltransferase [Anaerolentibacter hominis]|uniref:UDP-glucose--hexose-1-phosphate uridylyltransferase n=1 Tax=Anaerolentibacter hominis TaxID=3079009 RepID=UPI003CCE5EC5